MAWSNFSLTSVKVGCGLAVVRSVTWDWRISWTMLSRSSWIVWLKNHFPVLVPAPVCGHRGHSPLVHGCGSLPAGWPPAPDSSGQSANRQSDQRKSQYLSLITRGEVLVCGNLTQQPVIDFSPLNHVTISSHKCRAWSSVFEWFFSYSPIR